METRRRRPRRAVFTCFDVPDTKFPVAGHPWYTASAAQKRDVADRKLLDDRVRIYGDNIAAVVAEDEVAADRALRKIKVEYEEYPVTYDPREPQARTPCRATDNAATPSPDQDNSRPGYPASGPRPYHHFAFHAFTGEQSQAHIEVCVSYCYEENGKLTCVSSTQIPHICRRIIGQALDIPWGSVRVIKPYIGGGFGTKQDIHFEPLNAWLCHQVGGRCVKLELSREECFWDTSGRQPKDFEVEASVGDDMRLHARSIKAWSNTGGYIHHGPPPELALPGCTTRRSHPLRGVTPHQRPAHPPPAGGSGPRRASWATSRTTWAGTSSSA